MKTKSHLGTLTVLLVCTVAGKSFAEVPQDNKIPWPSKAAKAILAPLKSLSQWLPTTNATDSADSVDPFSSNPPIDTSPRDPFTTTETMRKLALEGNVAPQANTTSVDPPKPTPIPKIQVRGVTIGQRGGIALVEIGNTSYLIHPGDQLSVSNSNGIIPVHVREVSVHGILLEFSNPQRLVIAR